MMDPLLHRMYTDVVGRWTGPMHLRLLLQPAMATFFGIRDGLKDAREEQPAYFWSLFTDPVHKAERLKSGLRAVGKVLFFALIMDAIYQFIVLHWFYPGEAILVSLQLAIAPYLIMRGPINRLVQWWTSRHPSMHAHPGRSR
jgi:hypothetical protein